MGGRTALVRVERGDVGLCEAELGDVDLLPGGIPPLGEREGLAGKGGVVDHLHGELEALAVQPFLQVVSFCAARRRLWHKYLRPI